ncbi:basic salivary proline-rich protein 1-like [Pecten maximus]|uniref:basic salivary proline-rich protein 1-like n=1 Tax=Pecten maximus TaxID=6579 RepID=UPI001458BD2B|nr:basic salivary proline-rich protein 1-like [Pecten maximus]
MYRLYRMSTRRRRRPKPQTGQDGQTSPNGPSTIQVPNGGTQNRAFSDDQGNYPRSRRRTPRTTETPMTEEQLSKPPRPGHLVPRRTDKNPTPSSEGTVQGNPPPKYGKLDPPQSQSYKDSTPSAPPLELNTFRLENQSNTNYKHLPQSGGAQGYDNTKPYISHNDKQYEALGKRQDEHPYTTPQNGNQRDRYGMQRDRGDREKLPSESRLGPPAKPHQYGGESKTSHPLDGHIQQPPSRNLPYQSDKQTSKPPNRYTSQPPHSSDKNTAHQQDRQTSHPPNRDTSYPSQPTNRNTSYPSDRHTSHSSDKQAAYQNVNNDTQYRREPRPTYPPTNEGRGGPGYPTYSSTPERGGASRQPQYKDMPIGQRPGLSAGRR